MKAVITLIVSLLLPIYAHALDSNKNPLSEITSKESLIDDMYKCDGEYTCLKTQTARILERNYLRNKEHGHALSIANYSFYARKYLSITNDPSFVSKTVELLLNEPLNNNETLASFYENLFLSGNEKLIKKYLESIPENLDLDRMSERDVEKARVKWSLKDETSPEDNDKVATIPEKETLAFNTKNLRKYIEDNPFIGACDFYKKYHTQQDYYLDSSNLRFSAKQRALKLLPFFNNNRTLIEESCANTKNTCERLALTNKINAHLGFNDESYKTLLIEYSNRGAQTEPCATLSLGSNLHELIKLQDNTLFKQTIVATEGKLGNVFDINDGSLFEEKKNYLDSLSRSVLFVSSQANNESLNILVDKIRAEGIALKFADKLSTIIAYESDAKSFTTNLSHFTNVVNELKFNDDEKKWLFKKLLSFSEGDELKITWMQSLLNESLSIENADVIIYKMESNSAQYTTDDLAETHRLINYAIDSLLIRFLKRTDKQNEVYAFLVEGGYSLDPLVKDKIIALEKVIDFFNESNEHYDTQKLERTITALLSFSIKTNDIDTFRRLLKLYKGKVVAKGRVEENVANIIRIASDLYPLQAFNIMKTVPVKIEYPTVTYCRLATNNYTKEAIELYKTHPALLLRYISEHQYKTHCSYELAVRSKDKELFQTLFIDKDYYQILTVLLDILHKLKVEQS